MTNGEGKGKTYDWLREFTDTFGNRYVVSDSYDQAIDFLVDYLENSIKVDKVWTEEVEGIPKWIRNQHPESHPDHAMMMTPRRHFIPVTTLWNTTAAIGEDFENLEAIVVTTFEELENLPSEIVEGKVVVFNEAWGGSYGSTSSYRSRGPSYAARKGAKAALIGSVTSLSLYTLHTGSQFYMDEDPATHIPAGCITKEDAELLYRLQKKGQKIVLSLFLNSTFQGWTSKRTVVAEITGSLKPDEMVLFGGHVDSWDLGTGALDDGGGVAITIQTLATIRALNLHPKRTLRAVFWTAEEEGYIGGHAFYENHKSESSKISLVMESDSGTFNPLGFRLRAGEKSCEQMLEVMTLLKSLNADGIDPNTSGPGDPSDFVNNHGVPGVELMTDNDKYWWYHHTGADTMTAIVPENLDRCSAVFAVTAYTVANLDDLLDHSTDFVNVCQQKQDSSASSSSKASSILVMMALVSFVKTLIY